MRRTDIFATHTLFPTKRSAVDAMFASVIQCCTLSTDDAHQDFVHGNVKVRQRMTVRYAIVGAHMGAVIGTDCAAESVTGFLTKFGDGSADV